MLDRSEWDKLNASATQSREGWRVFHEDEGTEIRYEIAPLADGVAMQMKAAYRCGDNHTVTVPWRAYPSRTEALQAFLDQTRRHFSYEASPEQKPTQKRMLALLKATNAGFVEPSPQPIEEAPQQPPTQVGKVKKRREQPVQKELF